MERKFYTYNAAIGTTSFVGALLGFEKIADAAHDERILKVLEGVYMETTQALSKKHKFPLEEQLAFTSTSKRKLQDYTIVDFIERNAREPQRKLADNERIMGPIKLMYKYGEDASVLERTAAAAIEYDNEGEDSWKKIKAEKTKEEILTDICGLKKECETYKNILKYLENQ